jgi:hypothetical protein
MTALYFLAFLLLSAGILLLLGMTPLEFLSSIPELVPKRKVTMKEKIKQSVNPKKPRGIRKIILEAQTILKVTNRSGQFTSLCTLSFVLLIVGIFFASMIDNFFLMPVLAGGLALVPFLYILLASFGYKRKLNNELEIALSVVTAEYIRTEDIVSAIEESLDVCRSPVKEVFQKFVASVTSVNANVVQALENMKGAIDSDVFREWVDAVILCQRDRTLKSTLNPIVQKFSEMRTVSGNLNLKLYEPFRNWLIMVLALFSVPFLMYSLNAQWGEILMYTRVGQMLLTVDAAVFFFALVRVIRLTRPIEFRR